MKKILMLLVGMMCSVSMALAADSIPVKKQVAEQKKERKEYVEVFLNDLPDAIINKLTQDGAMLKEAFVSYGSTSGRIYKVVVLSSDSKERTLYLRENGDEIPERKTK